MPGRFAAKLTVVVVATRLVASIYPVRSKSFSVSCFLLYLFVAFAEPYIFFSDIIFVLRAQTSLAEIISYLFKVFFSLIIRLSEDQLPRRSW